MINKKELQVSGRRYTSKGDSRNIYFVLHSPGIKIFSNITK